MIRSFDRSTILTILNSIFYFISLFKRTNITRTDSLLRSTSCSTGQFGYYNVNQDSPLFGERIFKWKTVKIMYVIFLIFLLNSCVRTLISPWKWNIDDIDELNLKRTKEFFSAMHSTKYLKKKKNLRWKFGVARCVWFAENFTSTKRKNTDEILFPFSLYFIKSIHL